MTQAFRIPNGWSDAVRKSSALGAFMSARSWDVKSEVSARDSVPMNL